MPNLETGDRNGAAITRFVILLVISGVSYFGIKSRNESKPTPVVESQVDQAPTNRLKTASIQDRANQISETKRNEVERKHMQTNPPSIEVSASEEESFAPDRGPRGIAPEATSTPSGKSVHQQTNIRTDPGSIQNVTIEPIYSTPVQAIR